MESGKSGKSGKSGLDLVPGFGAVGEIYYKLSEKSSNFEELLKRE